MRGLAVGRASEDSGCVAVEAFHVLYHPVAERSAALIRDGVIGKLEHIDIQFMVNCAVPQMHTPVPYAVAAVQYHLYHC